MRKYLLLLLALLPARAEDTETICRLVLVYSTAHPELVTVQTAGPTCRGKPMLHALEAVLETARKNPTLKRPTPKPKPQRES